MISKEETYRTFYNESDDNYYMHYKNTQDNSNFEWDNWTVIVYTDDDGYYNKNGIFKDKHASENAVTQFFQSDLSKSTASNLH